MASLGQLDPLNACPTLTAGAEFRTVAVTPYYRDVYAFDGATDEEIFWNVKMPRGTTLPLTFEADGFMATATSGSVRLEAYLEAITPLDALDLDSANSFGSTNSAGTSVPGTA